MTDEESDRIGMRHHEDRPLAKLTDEELHAVSVLCDWARQFGRQGIVDGLGDVPVLAVRERSDRRMTRRLAADAAGDEPARSDDRR